MTVPPAAAQRAVEVVIFGEALVDFLPDQSGALRYVERFLRTVGGAPANLAVGLARLGARPALLTRVGDDEFGHYLATRLAEEGVDVSGVQFTREAKTGITFISLDERGERSFLFFREPSADLTVEAADLEALPSDAPIAHLGSNLMTTPGGRAASLHFMAWAREHGKLVSFDANIRLHLWRQQGIALDTVRSALEGVDLLKVSAEELALLRAPQDADPVAFFADVQARGVRYLVITMGADGARVLGPDLDVHVAAPRVDTVDTTGAGDAFQAGLLFGIGRHADPTEPPHRWMHGLSAEDWRRTLALGTFLGARVCTALGATTATPARRDVPWAQLGWGDLPG